MVSIGNLLPEVRVVGRARMRGQVASRVGRSGAGRVGGLGHRRLQAREQEWGEPVQQHLVVAGLGRVSSAISRSASVPASV